MTSNLHRPRIIGSLPARKSRVDGRVRPVLQHHGRSSPRSQLTIHHANFNKLEDNIEAVENRREAGAEFVLALLPRLFLSEVLDDVHPYTKAFCDATNLAVMLFPMTTWGFFPVASGGHACLAAAGLLRRLPQYRRDQAKAVTEHHGADRGAPAFHEEVVISSPIELRPGAAGASDANPVLRNQLLGLTWARAASRSQAAAGGQVRRGHQEWYRIDRRARRSPAWLRFWRPAQRMLWKYRDWLQGYNGGPLPVQRLASTKRTWETLRRGLERAGLNPTPDLDEEFFIGPPTLPERLKRTTNPVKRRLLSNWLIPACFPGDADLTANGYRPTAAPTLEVRNPATGELIGRVPNGGRVETERGSRRRTGPLKNGSRSPEGTFGCPAQSIQP